MAEQTATVDAARAFELANAAWDVELDYNDGGRYADGLIEITMYHAAISVRLLPASEMVLWVVPVTDFDSEDGDMTSDTHEVYRFRPGAWCDYLAGLAKLAREVRAHNVQAAADFEARAFTPIDDAALFAGVTPQLLVKAEPKAEPTPAERLYALLREIVQAESGQ